MAQQDHTEDLKTPDALNKAWVDLMPEPIRPYLRLMRADRPVGTWLLLLPCYWGLTLGMFGMAAREMPLSLVIWYGVLFAIGAFAMRGAGCVYNDIVDRKIDAQVARTANRPLASGQIALWKAWLFLVGLCFIGLIVLLQFNQNTIYIGLASLSLVAAYPFMKRITWWPQAWLGLTFNWGILVGWTATTGTLSWPAVFLYIAGILWTLGYDTIYAHQDKEDDALIGVKSTALKLQGHTRKSLILFYGGMWVALLFTGMITGLGGYFYIGLLFPLAHLAWQIWRLEENHPDICLGIFKSNRETGLMIILAILLGHL